MKATGLFFVALAAGVVSAPAQKPVTVIETGRPVFRVTVVSRTIASINYHHRSGSTHVAFRGTELMPQAHGDAKIDSKMGSTTVDVHVDDLGPATQFGPEYLTYVVWAVTPEGRAENLGELALNGDHSGVQAATSLQAFGLIVTAEPYFAVTQPSDVVVMENFVRDDTKGNIEHIDAKYELLKRGQYVVNRSAYLPVRINPKGPLQLAEAQNAVEIARLAGADRYAPDTFQKAAIALQNAQDLIMNHGGKAVETDAREAAQMAEDARIITMRRISEEQLAQERRTREQELNEQRAEAAQAQASAQQADAQRAAAEAAARQALQAKADAEAAREAALQQQQQAEVEAARARQEAADANAQKQAAEADRGQMRERLYQQLNNVMETRQTARGLIVNIGDVLFDFDKYTLKPGAREKMAKVAGILMTYPGLQIQLEGHTDAVGTDEYNLGLSTNRANSVRAFLVEQGVPAANISATGLGKDDPVATNDTPEGRQQNRRVELVITGESIDRQPAPGQ